MYHVLREAGGRNRLSRRHSRASRASSGRSSTSSSGRIDLGTLPFHLIWQKTVPAASTSSFSITCAHPCRELFAGRAAVRGTTLARPFWPRLKALLEGGGGGVSAACARLRCCCFFDRVARFGAYMGLSPSIESTAGSATSCGGCSPTIFCFGVSPPYQLTITDMMPRMRFTVCLFENRQVLFLLRKLLHQNCKHALTHACFSGRPGHL